MPSVSVPGLHGPFIARRLPEWLKYGTVADLHSLRRTQQPLSGDWFTRASADEQRALLDLQARSRQSSHLLARTLKGFKGIAEFAEPLLKARLNSELGMALEVNQNVFVQMRREPAVLGTMLRTVAQEQSLLQAALQNFASGALFEAGTALAPKDALQMELVPGSEQGYPRFTYRFRSTLALSAQRFAQLCHELDLGGQYQQHLAEVFDAVGHKATVREQSITTYKDQLRLRVQSARMKGEISAAAQQTLTALLAGEQRPLFNGKPARCSQLQMFNTPLSEVLIISAERQGSAQVEPVILYLPGAPLYPLKEYPSARAAQEDLRINLLSPVYQALLRRYVPQAGRAHVMARLEEALYQLVENAHGVFERQPNPKARLYLRERDVQGDVFEQMQDDHVQRLKNDARLLAVPSSDADEQARQARLAYWESIGFNLLNAAAFFVPGLGEVMAGVAAVQLVNEVIEGAQAWEQGDLDEAFEHLGSVALNLAFVAGMGLVSGAVPTPQSSDLLDGLSRVSLPDGQGRLWRADLGPYASDVSLAGVTPDGQGQYQVEGSRYVRIAERAHRIEMNPEGDWCIPHPDDPLAYRPVLRHNGSGAWQALGEKPVSWEGLTLWRRLGHVVDGLSDDDLQQVAQATGIDDAQLRRLHVNGEPLPALLDESLMRWRLHAQVRELQPLLRQGQSLPQAATEVPLALLTHMPGWPSGVVLEVVDGASYGVAHTGEARRLLISAAQLSEGSYMPELLALLQEREQKALIGPYLAAAGEDRVQQLRAAYSDFAQANPARVFDSLHAREIAPAQPAMQALRRDFPGLPWRSANALLRAADQLEHEQLLATPPRVPLRLAEQVRGLLEELRLNRACESLLLGYPDTADTRRLLLGGLQKLPGWHADIRLEVRAFGLQGALLDSVGEASAAQRKYLVRGPNGYQAHDADGNALAGEERLPAAILHALPDDLRTALGIAIDQPAQLQRVLARTATSDREGARNVLQMRPRNTWFKAPLGLEEGVRGYPLSGRGTLGGIRGKAMIGAVQELYPQMSVAQVNAFLDGLGVVDAQLPVWLEQQRGELVQLRSSLSRWVAGPEHQQVGPTGMRLLEARRQAAAAIEQCWRRQTEQVEAGDGRLVGFKLDLGGRELDSLPPLPGNFAHVAELRLDRMRLSEVPGDFLQAFPTLRWLTLSNNRLTRLPLAIGDLAGLTKLHLQNNGIVLDAEAAACMARLHNLKVLELNGNPLGLLPDVSAMQQLRGLMLRRTGVASWPPGVFALTRLEALDLRENHITTLPAQLLEATAQQAPAIDRVNRVTFLTGNPLSPASLSALALYSRRTGISMGLLPALQQAHLAETLSPEAQAAPWLVGSKAGLPVQAQTLWNDLIAEPGARDFFQLLNDLRQTADFQRAYPELKLRVWRLLVAASEDSVLRAALFEAAAHPETCGDGVVLVFSQLEVRQLVHEALTRATQPAAEGALMELARGLARLDSVERIALRDIAERVAAGQEVDEVEVRLAYRVQLAETLQLPGQPGHMLFRRLAHVTAAQAEAARVEVLAGETPQALKQAIATREFWTVYLKQQYRERFEALNNPYHLRLEALERDKEHMPEGTFLSQAATISERRQVEEQRLIELLTAERWNSVPGHVLMS